MNIFEMLTKPFFKSRETIEVSSEISPENIEKELDAILPVGFKDDGLHGFLRDGKRDKYILTQNAIIQKYRKIAKVTEVSQAIDEIVDECIFNPNGKDIISLDFTEELSDDIKDKLVNLLQSIQLKMNLQTNIYSMFYTFYVDGQINILCQYNEKDMGAGIHSLSVISPFNLTFDYETLTWKYEDVSQSFNGQMIKDQTFSREEIIRADSGIYSEGLILGNLHNSIKPANMLSTLEDMLIPIRYSRSTSRRVFNIDVSNLNAKKAEEFMEENKRNFAYDNFYNIDEGTIANHQHVTALTEDYWFPNRNGEKGTTVDSIDETGNLGEIDDILYFKRKLYSSLKVPIGRINDMGDNGSMFDHTETSISRDEVKFFNFTQRLKNQFLEIFYELLKREAISSNVSTAEEWEEMRGKFRIKFLSENIFYEKMERDTMTENFGMYTDAEELASKGVISYSHLFKKILKFSDDDIIAMQKEIEIEKKSKVFKKFYEVKEDDY